MFVVMSVSDFPAWEPGEAVELDEQNRGYRSRTPRARWCEVAAVSVAAVADRPGPWTFEQWDAFGRNAGLRRHPLMWFDSLFMWPICVIDGAWVNGRHRARLLERAGARKVAVEDPDDLPEWVAGESAQS
ncbi:hypothetical protein [Actinotalea subterranea]|uniref:hypothetical protein n=1 Tax=Actinotalea subterranea TaxID=2607497 RepID=UPI0011EF26B3|nr:hypothetical protein [Actinotalea subterranea]